MRWRLPLLIVCAAVGCGNASSGAPVETPLVSVGQQTQSGFTTAPTTEPEPITVTMTEPSTSVPIDMVTTIGSTPTMPDDVDPPTSTAVALLPPPPTDTLAPGPEVTDGAVRALAAALGLEGEVEHMQSNGSCVGRLEPRGLCVNVPIPGSWQYWDLEAQNSPGASDEEAGEAAIDVFVRIGVAPGVVTSVAPNGPQPEVTLSNGALVRVAEGGRISWMIAGTEQMPAG